MHMLAIIIPTRQLYTIWLSQIRKDRDEEANKGKKYLLISFVFKFVT